MFKLTSIRLLRTPLSSLGLALGILSCVPINPLGEYNVGDDSSGGSAGSPSGGGSGGMSMGSAGTEDAGAAGSGGSAMPALLADTGPPDASAPVEADSSAPGTLACEEPGEIPLADSCYLLVAAPSSWSAAQATCEQWGGALVTFNSADEETAVLDAIPGNPDFWIGLNDIAVEGVFEWVSQQTTDYFNWDTNLDQPTPDLLDQDCGARLAPGWYDIDCDNEDDYGPLCERPR